MPVVTPEDRSTQGPDELHIGLEVPRHAARQIHLWAEQQDWPEGTELERPEEYHVTLLYTPGGHEQHEDAWWIDHMEETEVGVRGVTSFGAQEKGFAYVLLLDSPEIRDHAEMLQERAEAMGLEVTHFPGGYKPHITVAYGPTRLPTKPEVPNWRFHVGPSSVSEPRTEKTSAKEIVPHYHPWTGLLCHCAWGSPKPRRGRQTRTAGVEGRKLLKAPDKAWRTPKGDEFRQHLAQLPEEYDPLLPYLAQRYKRGDVRLQQVPGGNEGEKRLRYIDNYQWPQHQIPRQEGPAAPVWRNLTGPYHLDKWLQWYNARQHPTRRGVNIMDPNFTPVQLQSAVRQHQEALRQEQEKVNWLSNYGAHARPEHVFGPEMYEGFSDPESDEAKQFARKYWGWQVAPLDAHQAEGDSEALGHCIGRDDQPYKHNIDIGNIQAFSLRDKEGYPHVSWHINPSGDSIGHMQGKSGYPNDEYRQLISTFNEARGYPDEEGGEEELEPEYDTSFEFPAARDMEDYIQYHHPEDRWEYAHERANFDPEGYGNEDLYNNTPSWRDIASDYLNNGGSAYHEGHEDKFYETLRNEGHWGAMAQGLKDEADHDDESHRHALNEWNEYAPAQHEVEVKPPPANEVDKYNEIHNEGNFPAWPDDWGHLARDYLDYYDNYSSAGWHPTIGSEYDQFHTNLGENGHAPNMRKALMANIDWEDEDHQKAAHTWNYGMPRHNIHPPEPEPEPPIPGQTRWGWPRGLFSPNYIPPERGINWNYPYPPGAGREFSSPPDGTFSRVAYNPDHVEADDSASLQAVAAQLHYRHEQTGSLNAQQATDYASRILHTLGYPTDQITLQAALQAWQSEYPEDKVVMEVSGGPEKFAVTQGELSQSLGQDDEVGLLAGSAHRTSQHGYVSPELQQIIDAFGNRYGLTLGVNETPNAVSFDHIEIPPEARGTGAGSRMMKQLKSYADRHGKPLKVEHVVNYPFFNRFDWMQPTGSDEYTYVPQSAPDRSTVPTQVNNPSDHWPEFGELPPDQHRDLGFSDDWAWHQGTTGAIIKTMGLAQYAEMVPIEAIDHLREYDRRPGGRGGSGEAADPEYWNRLKQSIAEHGFQDPITLEYNPDQGAGYIGEGNHRIQIAQELGHTHVPLMVYRSTKRDERMKPMHEPGTYSMENQHGYSQFPQYAKPSMIGLPAAGNFTPAGDTGWYQRERALTEQWRAEQERQQEASKPTPPPQSQEPTDPVTEDILRQLGL